MVLDLTSVNGMVYTWDTNRNLLSDDVNTYAYTSNKLSSISGENLNVTYQYRCNGLSSDQWGIIGCDSDRVSQTVNGVTTNYVLDIASPLTQVLQDGTNTYVDGVDRIAQMNGGIPEYFLTDGLGSVRQLVDSTGAVTLAKSYEPYGETISSAGSGVSVYQFTGEARDPSGLTYLRARYLDSNVGRFISRDTWGGNYNRPLPLNRWMYGYGNPVNMVDPSGHFSESQIFSILNENKWDDVYSLFADGGIYQGMWGILDILRMINDGDSLTADFGSYVVPSSDKTFIIAHNNEFLGTVRYVNGKFFLENNGSMVAGLDVLSNSKYKSADQILLERNVPLLNVTSSTSVYIYLNSTMYTDRYDFSKVDVAGSVNAGYSLKVYGDWGGAGLSLAGASPFPVVSIPASIGSIIRDALVGVQP